MNRYGKKYKKQQIINQTMLYQDIDIVPAVIIVVLTYISVVVLTYCRMKIQNHFNNKAMNENCKSLFIK